MGLGICSMGTHLLKPQSISLWVSHCRYPLSTDETHRYLWDLAAVGPFTHAPLATSDLHTHSHLPHTCTTTFLTHVAHTGASLTLPAPLWPWPSHHPCPFTHPLCHLHPPFQSDSYHM